MPFDWIFQALFAVTNSWADSVVKDARREQARLLEAQSVDAMAREWFGPPGQRETARERGLRVAKAAVLFAMYANLPRAESLLASMVWDSDSPKLEAVGLSAKAVVALLEGDDAIAQAACREAALAVAGTSLFEEIGWLHLASDLTAAATGVGTADEKRLQALSRDEDRLVESALARWGLAVWATRRGDESGATTWIDQCVERAPNARGLYRSFNARAEGRVRKRVALPVSLAAGPHPYDVDTL